MQFKEKNWHQLFEIGVVLKGLNGAVEIISGLFILFVSKVSFNALFVRLTRGELLEDPNDRLIHWASNALQHLTSNTKVFVGIYVLAHGILNIFLSVQLYREKLWAFVLAMWVMAALVIYQAYRISHTHSVFLTIITILDIALIGVIWHEYKYRKSISSVDQ